MLANANVVFLKNNFISKTGLSTLNSHLTKATSPTAPNITSIIPKVEGSVENPYMISTNMMLYSMEPVRSNFSPRHEAHSPFNFH